MNLKERLQLRAMVNLILSVLEKLINIIIKLSPQKSEPLPPTNDKKRKPLKKIVDTIDKIVPMPWKHKK